MIRSIKLRARAADTQPESLQDIQRAFALCTEITRDHSKSFYFSTSFLLEEKRDAIRAFYAFCRTTDDMVDVVARNDSETKHHLDMWRRASRLPPDEQENPVLTAWTLIRDQYAVPQGYAEELIDGCEMDLTIKRYDTWEQLKHYCYCVASTVGLISMHIVGVNNDDAALFEYSRPPAIDLGIALQLTNILRDVGEDLGRNRVYLPAEDMHRFGYTEDDLRNGVIDNRFRALMRFEIERAQALYQSGLPSIANLKSDGRLAVGAAIMLYRDILNKIIENDFDVFTKRAHLTFGEKLRRMPRIAWQVRK